jgi:hypothetical protein
MGIDRIQSFDAVRLERGDDRLWRVRNGRENEAAKEIGKSRAFMACFPLFAQVEGFLEPS